MTDSKLSTLSELPPLGSVEAFVAVIKTGSFSEAAQQLGLSTSALSRRVKALEDHIGDPLLDRRKNGARPTQSGLVYLEAAEQALELLTKGRENARAIKSMPLKITVAHFVAETFITEHIVDFELKNPDITLNLDTSPVVADLRTDDFDLAIRYGMGDWPGVETEPLFISQGGPACAPQLAYGIDPPRRIEALSKHTLLHFSQEPHVWARYFSAMGCKGMQGAKDRYFDDGHVLYSAACQGLGVVLIDNMISKPLLDSGALFRPFGTDLSTGDGFHFVYAPGAREKEHVKRFCNWVMELETIRTMRQRNINITPC